MFVTSTFCSLLKPLTFPRLSSFLTSNRNFFKFYHENETESHYYKLLLVHLPTYTYLSLCILTFLLLLWHDYLHTFAPSLNLRRSHIIKNIVRGIFFTRVATTTSPSLFLFPTVSRLLFYPS